MATYNAGQGAVVMNNTPSVTTGETLIDREQRHRTRCMAITISCFCTLIFLAGLAITILNGIALRGGTRVEYATSGSSGAGSSRNYYAGLWFGSMVSKITEGVIIFCQQFASNFFHCLLSHNGRKKLPMNQKPMYTSNLL